MTGVQTCALPISCLGLQEVDPGVKEAARGMGMSKPYRVLMVEFPLAFPTVFTGIRIAVVNAIGTAVFAAFVGGGGLGGVITQAIRIKDMGGILAATGVLMVIAAVLDLIMGWFEHQMRRSRGGSRKMWIPVAALLLAFCLLLPYGRGSTGDILLYDGDYSETQLMHRMVKLLVEDRTDLTVTIQDQMSQVNNFKSMTGDDHTCDLMISYDGTLLTTFFGQDPTDVPAGMSIYDYVNGVAQDEYGMVLLDQLGFDNTYAIGVPEALAEQYGLETTSDLAGAAGELTFGGNPDYLEREDGFPTLCKTYGLDFRNVVDIDIGLKYQALAGGDIDVTNAFTTDAQLANPDTDLVTLEDDKHLQVNYFCSTVVRRDALEKFPGLEEVLMQMDGILSDGEMAALNYQVEVEGRNERDAARDFLLQKGLLEA